VGGGGWGGGGIGSSGKGGGGQRRAENNCHSESEKYWEVSSKSVGKLDGLNRGGQKVLTRKRKPGIRGKGEAEQEYLVEKYGEIISGGGGRRSWETFHRRSEKKNKMGQFFNFDEGRVGPEKEKQVWNKSSKAKRGGGRGRMRGCAQVAERTRRGRKR